MSLEETAKKIAERINGMEYIEVYSHHDADGIAAAAIISIALQRKGIAFRVRILPVLKSASEIEKPEISILCDLGASIQDLPESTIIIDHHVPYNKSPFHINPRLFGYDGEYELSAAGCAYIVANQMADNRDLAGLVMIGILGDVQSVSGCNEKIIGEAIGNNLINPEKSVLLTGRTTKEQIEICCAPYLPSLSGNAKVAGDIEALCSKKASEEAYTCQFLSEIIAKSDASYNDLMNIYGDSWRLEREVIQNAHILTAVIDACGKSGHYDLAYAVACGDASVLKEAWNCAVEHRRKIIDALKTAEPVSKNTWLVNSTELVSDCADILTKSKNMSVFVLARGEKYLKFSARAPPKSEVDFEKFIKSATEMFGGTGGGHKTRAGAELPLSCETEFIKMLEAF